MKDEIKRQNCHFDERISTVETRCDNIQKTTLAIDDKFSSKICLLYTSVPDWDYIRHNVPHICDSPYFGRLLSYQH